LVVSARQDLVQSAKGRGDAGEGVSVVKQCIRLRGISDEIKGKVWEHDSMLRAGRLASLEIVLDDSSVSRKHAELRYTPPQGWVVRDLESTNGTYVNGVRVAGAEKAVHARDIVQFGKVALVVELSEVAPPSEPSPPQILVEAAANSSWEDAIQDLIFDRNRCLRPGEQLIALLRAGHHLVHMENEEDLLHQVLEDAVHVLDAQRGAIVLAEGPDEQLKVRALAGGHGDVPGGRFHYSQKIAQRCFTQAESILCTSVGDDPELAAAQSIADGQMSSVLCVLLRTARRKLGLLHLDRSYWQKPFTEDDLHLADALAANVSAGIECAALLKKQRQLFKDTITVLAQAVDLRDEYTGGHTKRVKKYALMLGQQLGLAAYDLELLDTGTPLHDIGKIGIKDAILSKPGKLTAAEFEEMKLHTVKGETIVSLIPDLDPKIRPIVRSHHERWDGNGYPDGLAGEAIPLLARIVAVVDAFDAMTSNRPYHPDKKGKSFEAAFVELEKQSGRQFDPQCVAAFLAIQTQVIDEMSKEQPTSQAAAPLSSTKRGA
jgi:HD-GYP domain-containing protein (c-di-GMP phosphodiesterase class II)